MPVDDALSEFIFNVAGTVVQNAGGLIVDHIFSRHTARFFHGVGRRVVAVATLGGKRIPSSLRMVPAGMKPKPRAMDWIALWVGVVAWVALFVTTGIGVVYLFGMID